MKPQTHNNIRKTTSKTYHNKIIKRSDKEKILKAEGERLYARIKWTADFFSETMKARDNGKIPLNIRRKRKSNLEFFIQRKYLSKLKTKEKIFCQKSKN